MRTKQIEPGNQIMERKCMKGLPPNLKEYVKSQIKKFETFGVAIPFGMIRRHALEMNKYCQCGAGTGITAQGTCTNCKKPITK